MTFGQWKVTSFIVITSNLEFNSCWKEKHSQYHWSILTWPGLHTTLDVMQESRIDDNWNIHGDRNLSEPWTRVSRSSQCWADICGRESGLQKFKQQPDLTMCGQKIRSSMSKAAQRKETPLWAFEKPKLDTARKLRGNYFIDPDGMEVKETWKKRKEKVGTSNGSCYALLAEDVPAQGNLKRIRRNHQIKGCMHRRSSWLWVYEKAFGKNSARRSRRSHCRRGFNSLSHYNPPSDENSGCKGSSEQGVGEARKLPGRSFWKHKKRAKNSPFCHIDGHLSSQKTS